MKINNIEMEEVTKIVIYGNGKKLFEREESNLKPCRIYKNKNGNMQVEETSYDFTIENITLKTFPVKARKENLDRKDNYFLSYKPDFAWREKYVALYIHESEIFVESLGDVLAHETEEEKCYLAAFKLHFKNMVTIKKYCLERIVDNDFQLPSGGKWSSCYGTKENPCFEPYDTTNSIFKFERSFPQKGIFKRWMEEEEKSSFKMIVTQRYYTKMVYSEERKRKDKLAEAINNSKLFHNQSFSHYDIDKLEQIFNTLTLKTGEN